MTWLWNELTIYVLRLRLWFAMRESERILTYCDRLLDAKAKRPAWLSEWIDGRKA